MKAKAQRTFNGLRFPEKVRAAMPMARAIVLEGIDAGTRQPGREIITERCAALMNDRALEATIDGNEKAFAIISNRLEGALALGIAVGLTLRPECFEDGALGRPATDRRLR